MGNWNCHLTLRPLPKILSINVFRRFFCNKRTKKQKTGRGRLSIVCNRVYITPSRSRCPYCGTVDQSIISLFALSEIYIPSCQKTKLSPTNFYLYPSPNKHSCSTHNPFRIIIRQVSPVLCSAFQCDVILQLQTKRSLILHNFKLSRLKILRSFRP